MVAEPWIVKMGNQVSNNLKHVLYFENSTKSLHKKELSRPRQAVGILSFEVANLMSKIIYLHKSLSESEIHRLKNDILKSEGVKLLVSDDEKLLLELALSEKLDDLNSVASEVSRLGKKCSIPALQGFEHVYGDIVSGMIDITELGFLVKDMESMVKKMERYVNSTANLYAEMEVMNELEIATTKFQQNQHEESRKAFEQKLVWQRQDVRQLKDASLWNQMYDKVVELLARTVCTVYVRLYVAFGDACLSGNISAVEFSRNSRGLAKNGGSINAEDFVSACGGAGRGRLLTECCSLASKVDNDDRVSFDGQRSQFSSDCFSRFIQTINRDPFGGKRIDTGSRFRHKSRLLVYAPENTVGGSALALHYANIIIVLEKLLEYPHLVGDEARDDVYQMLPTSLRKSVRTSLKSYANNVAIYDAPLAHGWQERLGAILKWLSPMAHNMIRWQSERNFEQQQIVKRTNMLLLQTLYFADREKTEAAICEVLVGLTYICRYEQQQNALLDCASSLDFDDCVDWQIPVVDASFRGRG
ncbi:uncharacterized protein LOC127250953 [Andrographis paniculata]|uniref:uncharacterized protein LOC127250953 n=1 Tax=Andrographis paniculata TaxID=175694 RepID=UPI0021E9A4DA|nr:uncharacterized protein LOC127250953 [Andrographis paniculata]